MKNQEIQWPPDNNFIYFPLVSVSEAANFLGIGRKLVYQLLEIGEIRAVKEKGSLMIEKKSLEAFRNSGKRI